MGRRSSLGRCNGWFFSRQWNADFAHGEWCLPLNRLDLVKVDIERAELKFLRGAQSSLQRFRPAMEVELSSDNLAKFGASPQEVIAVLEHLGYCMYRSKWHGLCRLEELPGPGRFFNAVALPRESVNRQTISWKEVRNWAAERTP